VGEVVGDASWKARVEGARAASGGGIVLPGARPLADVARWVAAADVFTLPSWAEGTPNVVLEALASGRPAVGTAVGGIPDVLADPNSGVVVPPKDPPALAAALTSALGRTWDAEAVRKTGPTSWDASGARLYEVLERARSDSRARGMRP
jgi:glycosyltransferase involved in cell wall biosynthesis